MERTRNTMNLWVDIDPRHRSSRHSTPRVSPMTATCPLGTIGRVSVLSVGYDMKPEVKHCSYSLRLLHPASIVIPLQPQIKIQLNR